MHHQEMLWAFTKCCNTAVLMQRHCSVESADHIPDVISLGPAMRQDISSASLAGLNERQQVLTT